MLAWLLNLDFAGTTIRAAGNVLHFTAEALATSRFSAESLTDSDLGSERLTESDLNQEDFE